MFLSRQRLSCLIKISTPLRAGQKNRVNVAFCECTTFFSTVVCFFVNTSTLQMLKLVFQILNRNYFWCYLRKKKKVNSVFRCFTQVLVSDT